MIKLTFFVFTFGLISAQICAQTIQLNANEFEKKLTSIKDKTVLDVRTKEEYTQGHLANATMIDYYKDDFKQQLTKLDKSKPIFVYCAAGGRSGSACKLLQDLGFSRIFDLQGGMRAWTGANKPVAK